jgi:hypothetical protein
MRRWLSSIAKSSPGRGGIPHVGAARRNRRADDTVSYDDYLPSSARASTIGAMCPPREACAVKWPLYVSCAHASTRAVTLASQALAEHLREAGSLGLVYPSARHHRGTCLTCVRPALAANVHRATTYRIHGRAARNRRLRSSGEGPCGRPNGGAMKPASPSTSRSR